MLTSIGAMGTYIIEKARSGRARCRGCDGFIDEHALRFGSVCGPEHHFAGRVFWKHLECVTLRQFANALDAHDGNLTDIPGVADLDVDDRATVPAAPGEKAREDAEAEAEEAAKKAEVVKKSQATKSATRPPGMRPRSAAWRSSRRPPRAS